MKQETREGGAGVSAGRYTPRMPLFLGLDIGTSATKAIVMDESGAVRGAADSPHDLAMPQPGWSEQHPDWWWRATCEATRAVLTRVGLRAADIGCVGLSGQMHGSVFLPAHPDPADPRPIRNALLWNDQRTGDECDAIEQAAGGRDRLIGMVGNPALTGFTAPKILWLRSHEPANFERTRHILLPKDYVRFRLTGELAIDAGDASGTLLLDPRTRDWHGELLSRLSLDRSLFPRVIEAPDRAGVVSRQAAAETGLIPGTPVVAGSGDQMTGAVGMGIVRPGLVSATLGTSGVIFAHAGRTLPSDRSGRIQIMCAAVPGEWCVYGCMLSAAGALHWFRDTCAPGVPYATLDAEADLAGPGAGGLLFLPYLTGERCPYPDPRARGAFIGLTARHTRGHLARAVLEGVALSMAQILDLVRALGISPDELRMSGGGAASTLWRRIHAAAFGLPITSLNTAQGSAYGAAILAAVGAGAWSSVDEACAACLKEESRIAASLHETEVFRSLRRIHERAYPDIRPIVSGLAGLEAGESARAARHPTA